MMSSRDRLRILLLAGTALTAPTFAQELPTGPSVAAGSVAVTNPDPGSMTVNQASQQAIVNWQSFSIGPGGSVVFAQPNGQSVILNRVTGTAGTSIAGQLSANGQVYIVNPNGLAITSSGVVSAGGFVGSTLDITDSDFLAGDGRFVGNGNSAGVSNAGAINIVPGGYAALIGGNVNNSGSIVAPLGKVGLGAGERVTLDFSGDGFLQVAVPSNGDGSEISHSGTISADGGSVVISAAAAQDAARRVVNLSGVVEARTVSGRSGNITLGGGGGKVVVTGRLDVSSRPDPVPPPIPGPRPASLGGGVTITGGFISLEGATIDASGLDGGGQVRIGGDLQGGGLLATAARLEVDGGTVIYADAIEDGDGGTIVLWSDLSTDFQGFISARGAGQGAGGFVEVSGKQSLTYGGFADLRSESGVTGTLLLDPVNIIIATSGGTITPTDLAAQLTTANVNLTTAGAGPDAGDISVNDAVAWLSTNSLTLTADNDIVVSAAVNGGGAFILDAAGDVTIADDVAANGVTIDALGNVVFIPVDPPSVPATVSSGTGALSITAGGNIVDAGTPGAVLTAGTSASLTAGGGIALSGSLAAGTTAALTANGGPMTVSIVSAGTGATLRTTGAFTVNDTVGTTNGDVVIEAASFINNGGVEGVGSSNGRFLIYTNDWTTTDKGGLGGTNLYGRTFAGDPPPTIPGTGDVWLYAQRPTVTVATIDASRVYGGNIFASSIYDAGVNGDTFAEIYGTPASATDQLGINADVGFYADVLRPWGLVSPIGYNIVFDDGDLTITPAPLTITASDIEKYLGLNYVFSGTEFTAAGLVGTDTIPSVMLSSAGAPAAAGLGQYGILASGAGGPRAANYTISYVPGTMSVVEVPPNLQPNFPAGSVFTDPPITLANPADELPGGLLAEVTADDARLSLQILEQRSEEFESDIAACQLELEQDGDSSAFLNCASDALEEYGEAIDDPLIQLPPELQGTVSVIRQTVQRMRTAAANPNAAEGVAQARAAVGDLLDFVRGQTALVRAVEPETEALLVQHGNVMAEAIGQLDVALVGAVEI